MAKSGFRFRHDIDDLTSDLRAVTLRAGKDMHATVRDGIAAGNRLAKENAERTSGKHARLYPGKFSTEMRPRFAMFGTIIYSGEYGPRAQGQGLLAGILENGSRNNPPHLNLARSTDIIGGSFAQEVRQLPDDWFWSEA